MVLERYNTVVIASNALYRKLMRKKAIKYINENLVKTFSKVQIASEYIDEVGAKLVLIDPLVLGDFCLEFLTTLVYNYPKIRIIFCKDVKGIYKEQTLAELEKYRASFLCFTSEESNDIELIDSDLAKVFEKYDTLFNSLLMGISDKKNEKYVNFKQESLELKQKKEWNGADVVLIAASTGGPSALETLFSALKKSIKQPILIVQHMPEGFTRELCKNLEMVSGKKVVEGVDGQEIQEDSVLIAPGGYHMIVRSTNEKKIIGLKETEPVNGVRPAADVLFSSVAKCCPGKRVLVVILTGMGEDGAKGVSVLRKSCDCYCISQSENTSVVYGMPRAVVDEGLCDEVVDIESVAERVASLCKSHQEQEKFICR